MPDTSVADVLPYVETTPQETTEITVEPVTPDFIRSVASDLTHADLFGSFLICGTLVGLFVIRGFNRES